jgi:hypothetical protein
MNLLSRVFGRRKSERVEFTTLGHQPAPPPDNPIVARLLRERDTLRQQLKQTTAKVEFTPGRGFVAVFPFHAGDYARFLELMRWLRQLDGPVICGTALLVIPASLSDEMRVSAELVCPFDNYQTVRTSFDLPKEGWPVGANWSFLEAARFCREHQLDFWFNEPDCIPLKAGWFEAIRAEYAACGRPYMGFIEPATNDYPRHLTGNAAYHHSVFHHFRADQMGTAWDIAMADVLTPQAHATALFHQEFGRLDHPPTFHTVDDLRRIPKEAVVFHRNKDGSLIRVLREQRQMEQRRREGAKEEGGVQ